MAENGKTSNQQPRHWRIEETLGSLPREPVDTAPFFGGPDEIKKGLSPPPTEPVNVSPFATEPVQTTKKASSAETTK